MLRLVVRAAAALLLAACGSDEPPVLSLTPAPYAVGAIAHGELAGLDDVTVAAPFSVTRDGDRFEVVAAAEGSGALRARAGDHDAFASLRALAIDEVAVRPTLHGMPCTEPALFAVGSRASLPVELRGDGEVLHGDIVPPLTVSGATIDEVSSADGTLELRIGATPGDVTLSNGTVLEAFAPASVAAVTVASDRASVTPILTAQLSIDLVVAGRSACGDELSRTLVVDTPDTCVLDDGATTRTQAGLADAKVRGLHGGTCTVRVVLDGTGLSATKSLTVTR